MARALIAAGVALLVIGLGVGGMQAIQHYQAAVESQQVDAYTAAVLGPARSAGQLVNEQIVPVLAAYQGNRVAGAQVATDAKGWHAAFLKARADFASASHPGKLASIATRFDMALAEYATAVAFFGRLGDPGRAPAALVAGDAAATAADRTYGEAAVALACLRRNAGLSSVPEFKVVGPCPSS